EAEEVEGFGLPLSKLLTLLGRVAAEADQPGFVRVQRQFELAHSFLEFVKERPRLVLMLKADDGVVRAADDDHVARHLCEAPAVGPKVEPVVQVDIGQERGDYSPYAKGNFTFDRVICGWRTGLTVLDLRLKKKYVYGAGNELLTM